MASYSAGEKRTLTFSIRRPAPQAAPNHRQIVTFSPRQGSLEYRAKWDFRRDRLRLEGSEHLGETLEEAQPIAGALQKALQFYPELAQVVNEWADLPARSAAPSSPWSTRLGKTDPRLVTERS